MRTTDQMVLAAAAAVGHTTHPEDVRKMIEAAIAAAPEELHYHQHADDLAVDKFADAMKVKLAKKRTQGFSGWDDESRCSLEYLEHLLVAQYTERAVLDPVDIANLAMMVYHRRPNRA